MQTQRDVDCRIVVCDDEHEACEDIAQRVASYFGTRASLNCYESFAAFEENPTAADILIADIDLGDGNGITLATRMKKHLPDTIVIFVTAHPEFIEDSFEAEPLFFLTKPIRKVYFARAMEKAVQKLIEIRSKPCLFITANGEKIAISLQEIRYIEFVSRYAVIHLSEDTVRVYEKLSQLLPRLGAGFTQCHKSYIVNLDWIHSSAGNQIELTDGKKIPVSRARAAQTRDAVMRRFSEEII